MSPSEIRFLERLHNDEMLTILRSAPITTDNITICFDRQPDIFLLPDIKYEKYDYLGYFADNKLSGFLLNGYYKALVNGQVETVFHSTDYYISPDARGRGFSYKISDYLFRETYQNARLGYLIIMDGNKKALGLIGRRHPKYPFLPWQRIINKLEVRNIMITWPMKQSTAFKVRRAQLNDIPVIVSLLNNEHKDRLFGLIYSESTFENLIARRQGMTINSYYLAEDTLGNVCGVAAAWDCTSFKQNRVLNYGPGFWPAKTAYKLLSAIMSFTPLPEKGDFFRDMNITDWAVRNRDPEIMEALIRAIYKECRNEGYQSLIWGSTKGDPILKASKKFFSQPVISNIVLLGTQKELIEEHAVNNHLPYIDIACL
jgi:hypothetical protein